MHANDYPFGDGVFHSTLH